MLEPAPSIGEVRIGQVRPVQPEQVERDVARRDLVAQSLHPARGRMQPPHERGEIERAVDDDDQLAVEHGVAHGERGERLGDLREVPRERPAVATPQVNLAAVHECHAAEAIPLGLEEVARLLGKRAREARQHRRDGRAKG